MLSTHSRHEYAGGILEDLRVGRTAKSIIVASFVLIALSAQQAGAGEPIELGGKKAVTVLAAINAESEFASATLVGSADFAHITLSSRFEVGGGIRAVGLFAGPARLAAYFPYVAGRVNTNLFGAEENMLLYAGINVGVAIFTIDVDDDDASKTAFAGGPRIGFEYYFTPRFALRLDNLLTFGEGAEDSSIAVSNTTSFGARMLF